MSHSGGDGSTASSNGRLERLELHELLEKFEELDR